MLSNHFSLCQCWPKRERRGDHYRRVYAPQMNCDVSYNARPKTSLQRAIASLPLRMYIFNNAPVNHITFDAHKSFTGFCAKA